MIWLIASATVAGAAIIVLALARNLASQPADSAAPSTTMTGGDDDGASPSTSTETSGPAVTSSAVATDTNAIEPTDVEIEQAGDYRWLRVDPSAIRFLWTDDAGTPYGQLELARRSLEQSGERVVAITNGGIYRPGLTPMGLYVEAGEELTPLNEASGAGNFFLQPNGVFWTGSGEAGVVTTERFAAARSEWTIEGAVQSGPMLVIDSEINSRFSETSTSTHRRNAVGIDGDGQVLLVIADRPVNLWEMADRCRELGAVNALYLDGTLSRLDSVTPERRIFPNVPVASMIAVVEPADD